MRLRVGDPSGGRLVVRGVGVQRSAVHVLCVGLDELRPARVLLPLVRVVCHPRRPRNSRRRTGRLGCPLRHLRAAVTEDDARHAGRRERGGERGGGPPVGEAMAAVRRVAVHIEDLPVRGHAAGW